MTRRTIFHALGLHMHQPPSNLRLLIDANPWEAEQIIRCYERPARYAEQYRDVARLHIGFSGVLLEQLLDPEVVDRYRHILDIPEMLDRYARADNIELIGMGYFHPIFPLIPRADWPEQLERGKSVVERAFGRTPRGFWPPEMAFSMEMIPALVDAGYDYAVVDGVHVLPEDGVADVFRPYLACYDGVCITVVPRDRDVSNAQQSGCDATWFQNEVRWRVGGSARPHEPRLVTTWSDGENGGWFRQTHEGSGFFGHFFAPYMEHYRGGEYPIAPVAIADYLRDHPPQAHAQVQTGAWNVGANAGLDLSQWAGSETQRAAVDEVHRISARYWDLRGRLSAGGRLEPLERARRLILEAETSCYLFWGDAWVPHLFERTRQVGAALDAAESALAATRAVPALGARPPVAPAAAMPPLSQPQPVVHPDADPASAADPGTATPDTCPVPAARPAPLAPASVAQAPGLGAAGPIAQSPPSPQVGDPQPQPEVGPASAEPSAHLAAAEDASQPAPQPADGVRAADPIDPPLPQIGSVSADDRPADAASGGQTAADGAATGATPGPRPGAAESGPGNGAVRYASKTGRGPAR